MDNYVQRILGTKSKKELHELMGYICRGVDKLSTPIVNAFLSKGGDLNASDNSEIPYFWVLFKSRNITNQYIQEIMNYFDINHKFVGKNILLYLLDFEREYQNRILFIIENTDIDINYITRYGQTALIKSCQREMYQIAKTLINHNVNVNQGEEKTCISALLDNYRVRENDKNTFYELLRLIVDRADINFLNKNYRNEYTLLSFYAEHDRNEEIELLYKMGVNVNDKLFIDNICEKGNSKIFDLVINDISRVIYDPEPRTSYTSALIKALVWYNFDIADKLLELGCNVNFYDNYGASVLMNLLYFQHNAGLVFDAAVLLLKYKVDLSHQDDEGRTALFYANNPNVISLLVLHGANINHFDESKHTLLYYAVKNYRHELVKAVLNFGPSPSGIEYLISKNAPVADNINTMTNMDKINFPEYVARKRTMSPQAYQCLLDLSWSLILKYLEDYGIY